MARHRDAPTAGRSDVPGWGAFTSVVAAVLVGTVGSGWGWAGAVLGLGALVTGALWYAERAGVPLALPGPGTAAQDAAETDEPDDGDDTR